MGGKTILFYNTNFPDPTDGGVAAMTYSISKGFAERGYECVCLYFVPSQKDMPEDSPYFQAICMNRNRNYDMKGLVEQLDVNFIINNTDSINEFLTRILEGAADGKRKIYTMFHTYPGFDINSLWTSLIKGKPKRFSRKFKKVVDILRFRGYKRHRLAEIYSRRPKPAYFSDRMVLLTPGFIDLFISTYRVPEEYRQKFVAINNPLSYPYSPRTDSIVGKENEVLVVSRFDEAVKRLSIVFKIWKKLQASGKYPDWKLRIVGYGESENYYKKLVKKLGLRNVFFEGKREPLDYYRRASIFPMTSAFEGFPMSLTEAMQNGVVPVVFDTFHSLHEIVADGSSGFIVTDKDIKGYTEKLELLMSDDKLRQEMARNAIRDMEKFSVENTILRWEKLFAEE